MSGSFLLAGLAGASCAESEDLPPGSFDGGGGALADSSMDSPVVEGGEDGSSEGSAGAAGMGGQAGMDSGTDATDDGPPVDAPIDTGLDVVTVPGLVGYWPMDETTGPVLDLSGQNNHGTVQGTVNQGEPGSVLSALGFAGTGSVKIPNNTSLDFSTAATISFWIKLSSVATGTILSRGPSTGTNVRIRTSVGNMQITFGLAGGTTANLITSTNVLDSSWRHVAVVNDNSLLRAYVDGVELQSAPGGKMAAIFGDLLLGSAGAPDPSFVGALDELKWWNKALTAQEVCGEVGKTWSGTACT